MLIAWISSLTTKSPGDFIQANGFKYHLYADESQIYISIPDLSPKLQIQLSSGPFVISI